MPAGQTLEMCSKFVVGGQVITDSRSVFTGITHADIKRVQLDKGQKGRRVPIYMPLPANASPVGTPIWVITRQPGVKYRICSGTGYESAANVRADGFLLRGDEPVFVYDDGGKELFAADGTTTTGLTGYYYAGSWIAENWTAGNSFACTPSMIGNISVGAETLTGDSWSQAVHATEDANICLFSPQTLVSCAKDITYTWGTEDYANLGCEGDGRMFEFWWNSGAVATQRTALTVRFCSDPYTSTQTDAAALAGSTIDDPTSAAAQTFARSQSDSNYFEQSFHAQVSASNNVWNKVVLVKDGDSIPGSAGFSKTGNPLWSRITKVVFRHTGSVANIDGTVGILAGMYFGTPKTQVVQAVAQSTVLLSTRTQSLTIELDAPDDTGADVAIVVAVS